MSDEEMVSIPRSHLTALEALTACNVNFFREMGEDVFEKLSNALPQENMRHLFQLMGVMETTIRKHSPTTGTKEMYEWLIANVSPFMDEVMRAVGYDPDDYVPESWDVFEKRLKEGKDE